MDNNAQDQAIISALDEERYVDAAQLIREYGVNTDLLSTHTNLLNLNRWVLAHMHRIPQPRAFQVQCVKHGPLLPCFPNAEQPAELIATRGCYKGDAACRDLLSVRELPLP